MNARTLALIALSVAALIYGATFTIAKEVMPQYILPYGFIVLRVGGAALIFWIISLFVKQEKIERQDYKRIALAAFFGVCLNMLTFFKGLSYTTPISASAIMVTAPIMVLIFSSILIGEKIPLRRILGVFIGLVGAVLLIVYGNASDKQGANVILGNFLVFVNAASYGLYLVLVKKIITKYNPLIFVRWLYLFGFLFVLPFGFTELTTAHWQEMSTSVFLKIGYVVFFSTCVTYLCNLFALTKLKPTTVSVFIYLQPVLATLFALFRGSDSLNLVKVGATLLIFLGVFLVTKQTAVATNK
ncbi:multidrug transporter [Tenacibaculum holothuriorum]|uniref:Multidrug transporter n=1 Tax=Tenacibaculum holothuriorum TaxID=1635173 RepID=A0A1Y2PFU3_9FLAO|nr:DMT family transporter [Tenacibaculum holothuriorum]OSY88677.1 multidrug transporter [Tenacibaculum holothuriorum]